MLLLCIITLSISILFSIYVPLKFSLVVLLLSAGLICISNKSGKNNNLYALIVLFLFGFISVNLKEYKLQKSYQKIIHLNGQKIVLYGTLVKTAEPRFVIKTRYILANDQKVKVKLTIPVYSYRNGFYFFDRVTVSGKLIFDKSANRIQIKSSRLEKQHESPLKFIFVFKTKLLQILRDNLPIFYADFLAGLLIGVNGIKLDPELELIFRDLGLLHMLVVSGAQVALLTNCLLVFLKIFSLPNFLNFMIVTIFNAVFLLIVGGDLSVMRAVVMMQIALFLTYDNRSKQSLDVLYLSGIVLLLINPFNLIKLGFILSFLATFAVIDISPRVETMINHYIKMPSFLAETLSISLGPILLTSPVILYVYHRIDLLSIFSNIVIGPFIEIIVVYGFLALILAFILPFVAKGILLFILGILVAIHLIAKVFYAIPFHTYYLNNIYMINVLAYYLFIIFVFYMPRIIRLERKMILALITILLGLNVYFYIRMPDGEFYFYSRKKVHYIFWKKERMNLLLMIGALDESTLKYLSAKIHVYDLDVLIQAEGSTNSIQIDGMRIKNQIQLSGKQEKTIQYHNKEVLNLRLNQNLIYFFVDKLKILIYLDFKTDIAMNQNSDVQYFCEELTSSDKSFKKMTIFANKIDNSSVLLSGISCFQSIVKMTYDSKKIYLSKIK